MATAALDISMGGTWSQIATGGPQWSAGFSASGVPSGRFAYDYGTGDRQIQQVYQTAFNIAAGATLSVDLKGGTGEVDLVRGALNLSRVRWVCVEITTPGTGVKLQVGPDGVANAWQGWFSAVASGFYDIVGHTLSKNDPYGVWGSVGAGTKILAVKNPTGAAIAGTLVVAGY